MKTPAVSKRVDREAGFTLLEVMLAIGILGFLTTIMWGSFSQTVKNKRAIEAAQDRLHTVRVALLRMAREIEMAYISDNENTGGRVPAHVSHQLAPR